MMFRSSSSKERDDDSRDESRDDCDRDESRDDCDRDDSLNCSRDVMFESRNEMIIFEIFILLLMIDDLFD